MAKVFKGPRLEQIAHKSLGEFLFETSTRFADKPCQVDAITGQGETYRSERLRTAKLALHLSPKIAQGDVVVFCTRMSFDSMVPVLSSIYLGAKIATLHPNMAHEDVARLLEISDPRIVFVDEESVGVIEEGLRDTDSCCEVIVLGLSDKYETLSQILSDEDLSEEDVNKFRPRRVDPRSVAFLLFSSGTTAAPKAICQSHYGLLQSSSQWTQLGYDFRSILLITLYWVSGVWTLLATYRVGGCRTYLPSLDAELVLRTIEKQKITHIITPAGLLHNIIQGRNSANYNTKSLATIALGGAMVTPFHLKSIQHFFKNTFVSCGYGTSEIGFITSFGTTEFPYRNQDKVISTGQAAPGVTIKIVEPNTFTTLAPEQPGEILVKSPHTAMLGYCHSRNSMEPFDREEFFRTGDFGFVDRNGSLYIIDRIKELFTYRGFQVVPSTIEAVLSQHPDVIGSCVFGIPGHEEDDGCVPAAWVALNRRFGNRVGDEIAEFVNQRVQEHEKLRGGVTIVDAIPLTPSQKPARFFIRTQATQLYRAALSA